MGSVKSFLAQLGGLGKVQLCQAGVSPSLHPSHVQWESSGNGFPTAEAAWTLGQDPTLLEKETEVIQMSSSLKGLEK